MNKRLLYILVLLSALFFIITLVYFLTRGKSSAPTGEEVAGSAAGTQSSAPSVMKVRLFYYTESSESMVGVNREIPVPATRAELYRDFVETLLLGQSGYIVPAPAGLKVRAVYFLKLQEAAVVDFADSLQSRFPGGTAAESEFIYFIVDNLCYNFKEIKKVKILASGNEMKTLSGHLDTEHPYYPDYTRLEKE